MPRVSWPVWWTGAERLLTCRCHGLGEVCGAETGKDPFHAAKLGKGVEPVLVQGIDERLLLRLGQLFRHRGSPYD